MRTPAVMAGCPLKHRLFAQLGLIGAGRAARSAV